MPALRLTPSLRERVWGRKRLKPWFPDSDTPIGEAWFLCDRDLPLNQRYVAACFSAFAASGPFATFS